jgi:hypothetical protein
MSLQQSVRRSEGGDWIDREIESLRQLVENGAGSPTAADDGAGASHLRRRFRDATRARRSSPLRLPREVLHVRMWRALRDRRLDIAFYGIAIAMAILVGWLVAQA